MDMNEFQRSIIGLPISDYRWFDQVGSTNDEAMALAKAGAPDGMLIAADEQLVGRGRFDRRWITRTGAALAFSMIFRPKPLERKHPALYSPLGALAVYQSLKKLGLPAEIKWPNDVLISHRKLSGILAEALWNGDQLQAVVLGIGINITKDAVPPPDYLFFPATCVETEYGQPVDRFAFLVDVLTALFEWRKKFGSLDFYREWRSALAFRGQQVRIDGSDLDPLIGVLEGIDHNGNLTLRCEDGTQASVMVGDVHLRLNDQA